MGGQRYLRTAITVKEIETTKAGHSKFLADSSEVTRWSAAKRYGGDDRDTQGLEEDSLSPGKGKLSPTSSHLFKLILPLDDLRPTTPLSEKISSSPPTIFLLHPSQPLSHICRLIIASLIPQSHTNFIPPMDVSFRINTPHGKTYQWSDSTDLGDFVRDAARVAEFQIRVESYPSGSGTNGAATPEPQIRTLSIEVPTFESRTRFLHLQLRSISSQLKSMESLKIQCDKEAHRSAKRMAVGGFGMLVVYWGAVARLTFWDYGWDIMEPITYLSGLSTVILGYLWFLYQGREISYSSILDRSISSRRQSLYESEGFDIDRWRDLVSERRRLMREIERIKEDYEERDKNQDGEEKRASEERDEESDGVQGDASEGDGIGEKR